MENLFRLPTAEDIEQAALEHGISAQQLCVQAGIDRSTLVRYKRGCPIKTDKLDSLLGVIRDLD